MVTVTSYGELQVQIQTPLEPPKQKTLKDFMKSQYEGVWLELEDDDERDFVMVTQTGPGIFKPISPCGNRLCDSEHTMGYKVLRMFTLTGINLKEISDG